jgi:hypothetical protein
MTSNWEKSDSLLFLALWLGTLIWFARRVSWRRHRDGGDRLIVKIAMPLFILYIACCFSIYEAPQTIPSGTIPDAPATTFTTVEHGRWRREWWCAEPIPGVNEWLNYDAQASIKCSDQRREWCANHLAGPWEDYQQRNEPGIIEHSNLRRAWCVTHLSIRK